MARFRLINRLVKRFGYSIGEIEGLPTKQLKQYLQIELLLVN
jgi:hypothetical protein